MSLKERMDEKRDASATSGKEREEEQQQLEERKMGEGDKNVAEEVLL